jgi:CRP-like cAMP-binding protein
MENDECTHLDIILDGIVSIDRIDEDGNIMCVANFTKNDILGGNLLFSKTPTYPMTIVSKTDVIIMQISKEDIFKLMNEYPEFLKAYLESISDNAFILGDRIRGYVRLSLRQILINYLKKQSYIQKSNMIKLNMSKKDLAMLIGVQRTSLSRELAKMRKDKLIEYDRDYIKIVNYIGN